METNRNQDEWHELPAAPEPVPEMPAAVPEGRISPDALAHVSLTRAQVFLRRLRSAIACGEWRTPPADRAIRLDRLAAQWEAELTELETELATRRTMLAEVGQLRDLLSGKRSAPVRRQRLPARRSRRPGGNASLVVSVLQELGGSQAARAILAAVHERDPGFGGTSWRQQVYQILRTDPQIEKVGRGLYRLRETPTGNG